jgi:putative oxidoreductase
MDAGLLAARLVLGSLMAAHGSQKLFGWFGGYGLDGTAAYFEQIGFRPGRRFALAAALSEVTGGLLVAAGLLGPIGPALMLAVMIVAVVTVHWGHGLFAMTNGVEVPLLYSAGAAALALTGPGAFSFDTVLGLNAQWTPATAWLAIGCAVLGAVLNLAARRPAAA